MVFRWLALVVVVAHYAYLAYLVSGGFLAWRWPRTIWLHLASVAWAVLIVAGAVECPLTWAQNRLRVLGGQPRLPGSFVGLYVRGVFYPTGQRTLAQAALAAVILASWVGYGWRWHRRTASAR